MKNIIEIKIKKILSLFTQIANYLVVDNFYFGVKKGIKKDYKLMCSQKKGGIKC